MTLPTDSNFAPYVTRESHHHMPSARTAGRRSVCCRLSMLHGPPHDSDPYFPPKGYTNIYGDTKYTNIHGGTPKSKIKIKLKLHQGLLPILGPTAPQHPPFFTFHALGLSPALHTNNPHTLPIPNPNPNFRPTFLLPSSRRNQRA